MTGDFEKSKRLAYKNLTHYPDDSDICFNAGWAKLSDDEVGEGYSLLDKGRETLVWGDPHCGSIMPLWDGEENVTVLLRLERGLGDQIHQVRYARDLKKLGCTVVVSCSSPLSEILRHADGVDVVVQHEAACLSKFGGYRRFSVYSCVSRYSATSRWLAVERFTGL